MGRKRIARLMRRAGIQGVSRRRGHKTTVRNPKATPAADLIERDSSIRGPDELWVSDITFIPTCEGWLFLAVVVDACSRRVCGWSMRDDLKVDLMVDALGMATTRWRPGPGLIHHSDRGDQYRSLALGRTLRDFGVLASMGSRGDTHDCKNTKCRLAA